MDSTRTYEVLIVDDDELDRMALVKAISPIKANVTECVSGKSAMEVLSSRSFDCLVLDYFLNDCDGLNLVKRIRSKGNATPIIIATGHGDEMLAVQCIKEGAQDYLPKNKANGKTNFLARAIVKAVQLHESEDKIAYYKYFYETAPVGFYTTAIKDGSFLKANYFCYHMLGFESFEHMKKNLKAMNLYPAERRKELLDTVEKKGRVTNFEAELTLLNGEKKWVVLTARKCLNGDCIEGSIMDITEQKKMALELAAYKIKEMPEIDRMAESIRLFKASL